MNPAPPSEVAAAVIAGTEAAAVDTRVKEIAGIPFAVVPHSMKIEMMTALLDAADKRAEAPRRIRGLATHDEVQSFVDHVNRFKDEHSAIFADISVPKIVAIFDYHAPKGPRWGEHKSLYKCPLSKAWQRWLKLNEQWMTQDQFAEFIEANLSDIANPNAGAISTDIASPAAVVEMARNLTIRQNGLFQRQVNPTTGEMTLVNKVENDATSTKICRAFMLGIPVFEAGEVYGIEARIRFSLSNGKPQFMYSLFEVERVLRDAFDGVRKRVADGTVLPIFAGSPE